MRHTVPAPLTPRRRARALILVLGAALALGGCERLAGSRLNPLNWFQAAGPAAPVVLYTPPEDRRLLVTQVTELKIDRNPNGAIVRATGLPATQGWWQAELVELPQEDEGRIVFEFRLYPPVAPMPAGTPTSREITVAAALSNIELDGISTIQVQGATNALSARR